MKKFFRTLIQIKKKNQICCGIGWVLLKECFKIIILIYISSISLRNILLTLYLSKMFILEFFANTYFVTKLISISHTLCPYYCVDLLLA
jgi:hypothetical protein